MLPVYEATLTDCKNVYLPDEDTFLLVDTLTELSKSLEPRTFVEIGPGSGVVSAHIFQVFPSILEGCAVELSPYAADMTRRTAALNGVPLQVHEGSFFEPLDRARQESGSPCAQFDLVVFNPPYVPSSSDSLDLGPLDLALAGGRDGAEVILGFLDLLPVHLSPMGCCILVAVAANNIPRLEAVGRERGLEMKVLADKRLPSEHLHILCFTHLSAAPHA